ncbi:helix-hairpin-helix domain-containing protein [Streptomyces sp. NPDC004539]|uniref:helix-hairpin-helix domain-containing protein n=1 Tax=Streptomyces sp. NPDC004539 TaxID=3154280 RepID=UPI0033BA38E0
MSTDPETTETEPGSSDAGGSDAGSSDAGETGPSGGGEDAGSGGRELAEGEGGASGGVDEVGGDSGGGGGDADGAEAQKGEGEAAAPGLSEAQAELAAQKVERERIARRKAEKNTPITSGGKLSGTAADLLAAVRAVEGGAKPSEVYTAPARGAADSGRDSGAGAASGGGDTTYEPPETTGDAGGGASGGGGAPGNVGGLGDVGGAGPSPALGTTGPLSATSTPGATAALGLVAQPLGGPGLPAPELVDAVRGVLAQGGAPEALASQVATALGEGAGELLREDPWLLLRVAGVRPEQADGFARALLGAECGPADERRGRAMTLWLLEQAALAGHTALELPALTAALAQRGVPDADEAVQDTVAEGEALVFQDALEEPGAAPAQAEEDDEERPVRVLVGLERYALAEESLADGLARIVNALPKDDSPGWESAASAAPRGTAELIRAVASNGLVLHTGGEASRTEPAALLDAARALGLRAVAACHTASGRHRFASLPHPGHTPEGGIPHPTDGDTADGHPDTTAPAPAPAVVTLPGLLAGLEGPGRDSDGAFALDLLVLLDAPQLDVETAAMVVESLPDGARLVLSGDPGVLWSAGAGRVFGDLLAAKVCPQVASRTPDPGPIGELVSGIGIGELNQVEAPGKEIVIVPVRDAGEAVHRTVQLVADSVPRAFGVSPEETVVITPGHGGAAGTRALNAALKERLNPGPGRFAGFDPGDLVAYSPAPGRSVPGRVVGADADGLRLTCAGAAVVVPKDRVEQSVRHGWALTAHQAAGGRWPAAVVVLPGDAAQGLSRPWVYTAFGRPERHLSVVHGVEQALPRAVAEVLPKPRTTRLPVLLRGQVPVAAG